MLINVKDDTKHLFTGKRSIFAVKLYFDLRHFHSLPFDEKANVITHGLGLVLIVLAGPFLIYRLLNGSGWLILGGLSFCAGAAFVFLSSAYYHSVICESRKKIWQTIDHIAIFFLIGGTYTAFILRFYFDASGLLFLGIHWMIILAGIIFKIFSTGKYNFISTLFYLALGWMVVFILKPLTAQMDDVVLTWLIAGGIFYTLGVLFYLWERLPLNHGIWHLMVLAGCSSHFVSIYHFLPN